ncbi:Ig-like domain-containing protein, partial [Pseudomonas yamanorum]
GSTETATAGPNGSYSVTTPPNQPTGEVTAVTADPAGNTSPTTTVAYADITSPVAPTVDVATNPDGSVTVTGQVEPGTTVNVTYPDGTTGTVTAGTDGSYSVTSPVDQPTGNVVAGATDAAGNHSPTTSVPYVDSLAPATTGTVDSFADNVGLIQNPASPSGTKTDDTTPTLNGSLSADLVSGEKVNVYRDGTLVGEATVSGKTWTFTEAALADASYTYTVKVADVSGNLGVASNSFSLTVDTTGPSTSTTQVAINVIAGDDIINADESSTDVIVTGTVAGDYTAGDVVTLTTAAGTFTGVVAAGGTWSVDVAAGGLGSNGSQSLQVSIAAHDSAGNVGTVTASRPYIVNASAPAGTALNINIVAGDDIVNADESASTSNETISGTVTGEFTVGDVVTLTIGSQTYTASVAAGGLWSTTVPGNVLAAGTAVSASLAAHNAVGNEATVTSSRGYVVDTSVPNNTSTTVSFDPVTADNIVNSTESSTNITVTGSVTGDYAVGDVITLTVNGVQYTGTVAAGGTWSVANVAGSDLVADADHVIDASLAAHDNAGNVGTVTAQHNYAAQTGGVTTSLSIGAIAGDNIVNSAESQAGVTFSGVANGTFIAGDVVILTINGTQYTTTVDAAGNWSVAVTGSALGADGAYTATASIVSHDSAGNAGAGSAQRGYTVDTAVPDTSGTSLAISTVAGDNQVNLAESSASVQQTVSGTVSGEFTVGDVVTVTIGSQTYTANVTAGTGSTGVWSVTVPGNVLASASTVYASLAAHDSAGNVGTILAQHNYVVDVTAPVAPTLHVMDSVGAVQGNVATNGGVTDDTTPTYQGTGEPGATISLVIDGAAPVTVTVDGTGAWTYTAAALVADGSHTVVATQTDLAGNVSPTVSSTFTVSTSAVAPPTLVVTDDVAPVTGAVANAGTTNDTTPTFSGTGVAGATVHLVINGGTPVDVLVDGTGAWTYTPSASIGADGSYTVSATQITPVGLSSAVNSQFTLDTSTPSTASGYAVAITAYTDDVAPQTGS